MGRKLIDLTGQVFDKLKVIERAEDYIQPNGKRSPMWLCLCECGNKTIVRGNKLRDKVTRSCGCLRREELFLRNKKYNNYNLDGEYGIGYTFKGEEFWFDLEDYDKIKNYCWHYAYDYIHTKIPSTGKVLALHRLIMNPSEEMCVDHINHNKFDNRKKNLRIVTSQQNSYNRTIYSRNTSGTTGVSYAKTKKKWRATISVDKKWKHLGYFDKKEDAVKARKEAEEKYFGEYSYDNSMKGDEIYEQES